MKGKRKVVRLFAGLAIGIFISGDSFAASNFVDLPDNWARKPLEKAIEDGLIQGYDNRINPEAELTRAEMAAITNRLLGMKNITNSLEFKDLEKDKWYYDDMLTAVNESILLGNDGKLSPNKSVTREEAFTAITRAFLIPEMELNKLEDFHDGDKVSPWAKEATNSLLSKGYIVGNDSKIAPDSNINRAEFVKIIYNLVSHDIKESGEHTLGEVDGNVLIKCDNAIIKDSKIEGDLILSNQHKNGRLELDNCQVDGRVILKSGKELELKNSSSAGKLIVFNRKDNTSINIDESSSLDKVIAKSKVDISGQDRIKDLVIYSEEAEFEEELSTIDYDMETEEKVEEKNDRVRDESPESDYDSGYVQLEERPAKPEVDVKPIKPELEEKPVVPEVEEEPAEPELGEEPTEPELEEEPTEPELEEEPIEPEAEEKPIEIQIEELALGIDRLPSSFSELLEKEDEVTFLLNKYNYLYEEDEIVSPEIYSKLRKAVDVIRLKEQASEDTIELFKLVEKLEGMGADELEKNVDNLNNMIVLRNKIGPDEEALITEIIRPLYDEMFRIFNLYDNYNSFLYLNQRIDILPDSFTDILSKESEIRSLLEEYNELHKEGKRLDSERYSKLRKAVDVIRLKEGASEDTIELFKLVEKLEGIGADELEKNVDNLNNMIVLRNKIGPDEEALITETIRPLYDEMFRIFNLYDEYNKQKYEGHFIELWRDYKDSLGNPTEFERIEKRQELYRLYISDQEFYKNTMDSYDYHDFYNEIFLGLENSISNFISRINSYVYERIIYSKEEIERIENLSSEYEEIPSWLREIIDEKSPGLSGRIESAMLSIESGQSYENHNKIDNFIREIEELALDENNQEAIEDIKYKYGYLLRDPYILNIMRYEYSIKEATIQKFL